MRKSSCFPILIFFYILLKWSGDPTPEGGGTTPEGSLTLVSNLLLVVGNIGFDILGKFN